MGGPKELRTPAPEQRPHVFEGDHRFRIEGDDPIPQPIRGSPRGKTQDHLYAPTESSPEDLSGPPALPAQRIGDGRPAGRAVDPDQGMTREDPALEAEADDIAGGEPGGIGQQVE